MPELEYVTYAFLERQPQFTPREAIAVCRNRVAATDRHHCSHKPRYHDECAHNVACVYGFSSLGVGDAATFWHGTDEKYRRHGLERMKKAPRGAVLLWTGGSSGQGHAGVADGKGGVFCTDFPIDNSFGHMENVEDITPAGSALIPAGWIFPYFPAAGSDHRKPPKVKPPENEVVTPNIDAILAAQHDTIAAAKRALLLRPDPGDQETLHKVIKAARRQIDLAKPLHLPQPKAHPAAKKAAHGAAKKGG